MHLCVIMHRIMGLEGPYGRIGVNENDIDSRDIPKCIVLGLFTYFLTSD